MQSDNHQPQSIIAQPILHFFPEMGDKHGVDLIHPVTIGIAEMTWVSTFFECRKLTRSTEPALAQTATEGVVYLEPIQIWLRPFWSTPVGGGRDGETTHRPLQCHRIKDAELEILDEVTVSFLMQMNV